VLISRKVDGVPSGREVRVKNGRRNRGLAIIEVREAMMEVSEKMPSDVVFLKMALRARIGDGRTTSVSRKKLGSLGWA
jgi:hypothetical protein